MTATSDPGDAYRGYRFPGQFMAHAVWLYLRFPLSFRDVEEMLGERGIPVRCESVRKREVRPGRVWHLEKMAVRIAGKQHWLWRAVDEHGATLDVLLQEQRDTDAAERFFRVLLGHAGAAPQRFNTDKLGSYATALRPTLPGRDRGRMADGVPSRRGRGRVVGRAGSREDPAGARYAGSGRVP